MSGPNDGKGTKCFAARDVVVENATPAASEADAKLAKRVQAYNSYLETVAEAEAEQKKLTAMKTCFDTRLQTADAPSEG